MRAWIKNLPETVGERPCQEAVDWLTQNNFPTIQDAWDKCHRDDWMLWYITRVGLTPKIHRILVRAACEMVRRQLCHNNDPRSLRAIEAAELWANNPTEKNRDTARAAAWAAAWAARAAGAEEVEEQKEQANILRKHLPKIQ